MAKLEDFWKLVKDIEADAVTLVSEREDPQDVYAGDVYYKSSNGWKVVVFNDCNDWDYFDSAVAPDGTVFDCEKQQELFNYRPTDEVAWRCYGIPGYLSYREEKWHG